MPDIGDEVVGLDAWYADQIGPGGERVTPQLAKPLAEPRPYDIAEIDLSRYLAEEKP